MTVFTLMVGNKDVAVDFFVNDGGENIEITNKILTIKREVIRKKVKYVETRDSWAPDDFNMGGGVAETHYVREVFNYNIEDLSDWEREELSRKIEKVGGDLKLMRLERLEREKAGRDAVKAWEEKKQAKAKEREVRLKERRLARIKEEASRKEREAKKDADTWASANPFAALKGVIDD